MAKNGCSIAERPFFYWRFVGGHFCCRRTEFRVEIAPDKNRTKARSGRLSFGIPLFLINI